jgi:hypothetical protein
MEIKVNEGRTEHTEIIFMGAHFLPCTEYMSYIHLDKLILVI